MSADADALLGAIEAFVKDGHVFQFGHVASSQGSTFANVSGLTGSRSAMGSSVQEALEKLIVQIVEARLMPPPDDFPHITQMSAVARQMKRNFTG